MRFLNEINVRPVQITSYSSEILGIQAYNSSRLASEIHQFIRRVLEIIIVPLDS